MKRWHALYFALAILVAADALVGSRDRDGVLTDADRKVVTAAKTIAEHADESESGERPAPAPRKVATFAADNPWAIDDSDVDSDWGDARVAIGEYRADSGETGFAEPAAQTARNGPAPRVELTVAGDPVPRPDRSLVEG